MSERMVVYNWTVIHKNTCVDQDSRMYCSSAEAHIHANKVMSNTEDELIVFENLIEIDSVLAYRMLRGFAEGGYGFKSIQKLIWSRRLVFGASKLG